MSSTSTLRDAVKSAQSQKNTGQSTSDKNPAYYNRQKNEFIASMVTHSESVVRAAAASLPCCPTKQLQAALAIEQDSTVLRALLFNPNMPDKNLLAFSLNDERSVQFDEDEELSAYLVDKLS